MIHNARCTSLIIATAWLGLLVGGCTHHITPREFHSRAYLHGAVACDHVLASNAGDEMLQMGGNAVDAAVAASFALSVVRPHSCGLGGGGFMLIHLVDNPETPETNDPIEIAIDYRERTPAAVGPDHFFDLPDEASLYSGHAVAIPGTAAGLLEAHARFGTLPLELVMSPAVAFAETPHAIDASGQEAIDEMAEAIAQRTDPGAQWLRDTYVMDEPMTLSRVQNIPQARLLTDIMYHGRDGFYTGDNARHIVNAVRAADGVMTLEDLAVYRPIVTEPIVRTITLGGVERTFVVMPPPSSGGVALIETLGILERYDVMMTMHVGTGPLAATHPHDPVYAHALVECLKHAFADRARYMGDTEFVAVPIDAMLDRDNWNSGADRLHPNRTFETETYGLVIGEDAAQFPEDHGTSHLSVIDKWGNAVACTETINTSFGSRIAVPELGIVLNNEMDDFLTRVGSENAYALTQSERNLPAPGKRPLSSMSPTIVLNARRDVIAVAGASGGPRIITGTLQVLMNALHFGMPAYDAVATARLHHQWKPDAIYFETWGDGYPRSTITELVSNGHEARDRKDVGVVQLLVRRHGVIEAASDPRKGGVPAGH